MNELKLFVGFGLTVGELLSIVSKGVSFDVIKKLIECAKFAGPALKGAKAALEQYIAMSDEQAKELDDYVVAEFDIADDGVEAAVESAIRIAIECHVLVGLFVPKS